jgi:hypothetical protein
MNRLTLVIVVALIASSASARAEQGPSPTPSAALAEARQAIDKGNAQWIEAWDKADAVAALSTLRRGWDPARAQW